MEIGSYMQIAPGMTVNGTDGALGTVIQVVADEGVDVFRGIIVSHGLIIPKHIFVSADDLIAVANGTVQINVSKTQLDQLPTEADVATRGKESTS